MSRHSFLRGLIVIAGAVLSACGGGDTTGPNPPVVAVAAVVVTPAVASPIEGATVQLSATVRDAQGKSLTGRTVTWSTSDATHATVSGSGLVTAVAEGAAVITATSEGHNGEAQLTILPPPPPGPVAVTLDVAASTTARLGADGGTIAATRSGGATFTLAVPREALSDSTAITITPASAIGNLPLSGGLLGAVKFGPDGLRFAVPATLTIELPNAPVIPSGMKLVGFGYDDAGGQFHLTPVTLTGRTLTLTIAHFSGAGAGLASVTDVSTLVRTTRSSAEFTALNDIVALDQGSLLNANSVATVYDTWFNASIKGALTGATSDQATVNAIGEYGNWLTQIQTDPLFASFRNQLLLQLAADVGQADSLAAGALRRGVDRAATACLTVATAAPALTLASNMFYWQALASRYQLGTGVYALSAADITAVATQCVTVTAVSTFPLSVPPVQTTPLTVQAGVRLRSLTITGNISVVVSVTATGGASVSQGSGPVDAVGVFTTNVTPPPSVNVIFALTSTACPDPALYPRLAPLCGSATVTSQVFTSGSPCGGQSGSVVNHDVVVATAADVQALAGVTTIHGGLTIWGTGAITDVTTINLPCLQIVDGGFEVQSPSIRTVNLPGLLSIGEVANARGAKSDVVIINQTTLQQITLGAGLRVGAEIVIDSNTSLSSLAFSVATVGGRIVIQRNAALASLTLSAQTAGAGVTVRDNPALATALLQLGKLGGSVQVLTNALLSLQVFAADVTGDLRVQFNGLLTSLSGTGKVSGGLYLGSNGSLCQSMADAFVGGWVAGFVANGNNKQGC